MSLGSLRVDYVAGRIEAEEFEAGLDALVAADPDALEARVPVKEPWGTDEPGQIITYKPPSTANVDAVLKQVYAPQIFVPSDAALYGRPDEPGGPIPDP